MRYRDPATGRWLGTASLADELDAEARAEERLGVTIVDAAHGSFLSCARRLGCTNPDHEERRRDYWRNRSEDSRRAAGQRPLAEACAPGPHGTVSRYRKCTDGDDGGPCRTCKDAEAARRASYRR